MTTGFPALLAEALCAAGPVVAAVPPAGWSLPTPCASWCTRDVLNHVVATTTKFSMFACGLVQAPRTPAGDLLGADPLDAFERCRAYSTESWAHTDLHKRCHLPFGTYPAAEAAAINAFDVLVHTWDIAHAVGLPYEPENELTELAYMVAVQLVTPEAVAAGHYARLVEVAPPATPAWRDVLTLTGRGVTA